MQSPDQSPAIRDRPTQQWQQVYQPLEGHIDVVYALAISERHGCPVIVSGGADETVRVWDLDSGQQVYEFTEHAATVRTLAGAKRHGRPVAISGSFDETVRIWDLDSGQQEGQPFTRHDGVAFALATAERHGRPVVVSCNDDGHLVQVWDLETDSQPVLRIELPHQPMAVAAAGNRLVAGTTGDLLRVDLL